MSRLRIVLGIATVVAGAVHVTGPDSAGADGFASGSGQMRTFVAPVAGNDASDCSRTAPCQTLARALNQTSAHGTVTVLESGLVGTTAVTINRAVTIDVPAGIDAGLSRSTGILLIVNAPSNQTVTINGLSFDGRGTAGTGISYTGGRALILNHVAITDFNPANSNGVLAQTPGDGVHLKLYANDAFVSGARGAISLLAEHTGDTSILGVDGSRLDGNTIGVYLKSHVKAQITRTFIAGDGSGVGVWAKSDIAQDAGVDATITDSVITDNDTALLPGGGVAQGGDGFYVSRSTISGNRDGVTPGAYGDNYTGGDNIVVGNTSDNGYFNGPIPGPR